MSLRIGSRDGVEVELLPLGATVRSVWVTGSDGVRRDVVLGYADPADYRAGHDYLGATVGRYANRIAAGRLLVDGVEHRLARNDRGQHLHGGPGGFHSRIWEVVAHERHRVRLALESPAGEEGFPGRLRVELDVSVAGASVALEYRAETDAATVVNLTNHSYFNLDGDLPGRDVRDHVLSVPASRYTPVDDVGIPTGPGRDPDVEVAGTPFDLRAGIRLDGVADIDHDLLPDGAGLREVARLISSAGGLALSVRSDQPGLQVYAGSKLDGSTTSRAGHPITAYAGVALEPQLPPDSPSRPGSGGAVLRPGERYRHRMAWRFGPA
ncbi:galactose mutarotase [Nocardioides mangrovicus]|uniref:Aldose 1-epimerase n=1 Tax=Nocardioides mangrovicus TaxID=2478913 RepID=A0A3L8NX53_9ACTN|nr:aldose epimerase family protein [Nocardioides mangrovicus]RLV47755.1 galactose mutarotase [Nocardioides mangrovicus]